MLYRFPLITVKNALFSSTSNLFNEVQPLKSKQESSFSVFPFPSLITSNLPQPEKSSPSILSTLSGIEISFSDTQETKALLPRRATAEQPSLTSLVRARTRLCSVICTVSRCETVQERQIAPRQTKRHPMGAGRWTERRTQLLVGRGARRPALRAMLRHGRNAHGASGLVSVLLSIHRFGAHRSGLFILFLFLQCFAA